MCVVGNTVRVVGNTVCVVGNSMSSEFISGCIFGREVILFTEAHLCREFQGIIDNYSPFVGRKVVELFAGNVVLDETIQNACIEGVTGAYGAYGFYSLYIKMSMAGLANSSTPSPPRVYIKLGQ